MELIDEENLMKKKSHSSLIHENFPSNFSHFLSFSHENFSLSRLFHQTEDIFSRISLSCRLCFTWNGCGYFVVKEINRKKNVLMKKWQVS